MHTAETFLDSSQFEEARGHNAPDQVCRMNTSMSSPVSMDFLFCCSSSDQSLFKGKRLPFVVYPHILEYHHKGKLVARHSTNA